MDFILPHSDTIEMLDLEYHRFCDVVEMPSETSCFRLQTNSLPQLHSLRGHPYIVTSLAISRLHCLRTTLRRLAVSLGQFQSMFNKISSPRFGHGPPVSHLFALQEIELGLFELPKPKWRDVAEIIRECANCCPSLEVWRGTLPRNFKMDAALLGQLFGLFQSLRVVYLREDNILGPERRLTRDEQEEQENKIEHDEEEKAVENEPGNDVEEAEKTVDKTVAEDNACDESVVEAFVHVLALSCRALQNVSVRRTYLIKDWWTISRTWNPKAPEQMQICSLNRHTMEEPDLESWRISQCVYFFFVRQS